MARASIKYTSTLGCKHLPSWSRLGLHPEKMPRQMPPTLEWHAKSSNASFKRYWYSKLVVLVHHTPTCCPYQSRYSGKSNFLKRSNQRPSSGGYCRRTSQPIRKPMTPFDRAWRKEHFGIWYVSIAQCIWLGLKLYWISLKPAFPPRVAVPQYCASI